MLVGGAEQGRGESDRERDQGGTVAAVETVNGPRGVLGRLDNTEKGQGSMADLRNAEAGVWDGQGVRPWRTL